MLLSSRKFAPSTVRMMHAYRVKLGYGCMNYSCGPKLHPALSLFIKQGPFIEILDGEVSTSTWVFTNSRPLDTDSEKRTTNL